MQRTAGMPLTELLPGLPSVPAIGIEGIASDSRAVRPGDLFIAVPGGSGHGMDYVAAAVAGGATAVAVDPEGLAELPASADVPLVTVPGLKGMVGTIANRFFDSPSAAVEVVGVTGTNGKTTVAWLLAESARRLGRTAGYLGTLGAGVGTTLSGGSLTTPDTIEIHATLAQFRDAGADLAALEVSSHALDQDRIAGVRLEAAVFTNLSRDHLDYHGSMDAYFAAKAKLFLECGPAQRIVGVDTRYGRELAAAAGPGTVAVTLHPERPRHDGPYLAVHPIQPTPSGSTFGFASTWGDGRVSLPMPGGFNVANAALALATLLTLGVSVEDAVTAVSGVTAPPGRLERINAGAGGDRPAVYVDFAHTPEALEAVLAALRPHVEGRLHVVFGAGGDRDAGKRPLMGAAVERRADHVVLTSDNPRGEAPERIVDDVLGGFLRPRDVVVVEERSAAIHHAIHSARAADTVLIAGKGHEQFQEIGGDKRPFSDRLVAAAALEAWPGGRS